MICFLKGMFGAVVVLTAALFIFPLYSDYRASAETSGWLYEIVPTAEAISDNILHLKTTSGAGVGIAKPTIKMGAPSRIEVMANGTIFLKGGRDGQLVVLIPEFLAGKVLWRCIGGSSHATLSCNNWRSHYASK